MADAVLLARAFLCATQDARGVYRAGKADDEEARQGLRQQHRGDADQDRDAPALKCEGAGMGRAVCAKGGFDISAVPALACRANGAQIACENIKQRGGVNMLDQPLPRSEIHVWNCRPGTARTAGAGIFATVTGTLCAGRVATGKADQPGAEPELPVRLSRRGGGRMCQPRCGRHVPGARRGVGPCQSLRCPVPIADPTWRKLEKDLNFKLVPSPIHPLGHEPGPSEYKEVSAGHFAMTSDSGH